MKTLIEGKYLFVNIKIIVLIIFALLPCVSNATENLTLCKQAEINLTKKNLDEAIDFYKRCMKDGELSDPTLAIIYRNLGLIYFEKQDYKKSIDHFNDAIRLNKKDPWDDYVSRGNSWSMLGNKKEALDDYDSAINLNQNFAIAYFNRGIFHENFGQIDEAKKDFVTAREKGYRAVILSAKLSFYRLVLQESVIVDPLGKFKSDSDYMGYLGFFLNTEVDRNICSNNRSIADFMMAVLVDPKFKELKSANRIKVANTLYTVFPCPFSPDGLPLKAAKESDLYGVWYYPKSSRQFIFGPKSLNFRFDTRVANSCEFFGFYPNGEMRTLAMWDKDVNCGDAKAADFESVRALPRVVSWQFIGAGRLRVTRGDMKNYDEEWDLFVAQDNFIVNKLEFKKGDVIGYFRRDIRNDLNASLSFRHMRRLTE